MSHIALTYSGWAAAFVLLVLFVIERSRRGESEQDAEITRTRLDASLQARLAEQRSRAALQERFERECA